MILLVAGDPAFLAETEERLRASGCRVMLALSGEQAQDLTSMLGDRIGLAMVDVSQPDGSGFQAIHNLVRQRPGLPVIAFSGREERDAVLELAFYVGAKALLRKPVTDEWVAAAGRLGAFRTARV